MGTAKQLLTLVIMIMALGNNPCMAGSNSVPLSRRSIAPKEYDQAEQQRYRDDTQRQIDDLSRRIIILENGG